jgi:hypothetical protein
MNSKTVYHFLWLINYQWKIETNCKGYRRQFMYGQGESEMLSDPYEIVWSNWEKKNCTQNKEPLVTCCRFFRYWQVIRAKRRYGGSKHSNIAIFNFRPRGLRHELSSPAPTLRSWVPIPPRHGCFCVICVLFSVSTYHWISLFMS